jgi:hypothetical protein
MLSSGDGRVGRERKFAADGLKRIPLDSMRGEPPAGLQELYTEVSDGQAFIPGLRMGIGALVVERWDPSYAAAGWTLHGADLTLDMGHPFGSMFYRNDADGRVLRVGVKWHPAGVPCPASVEA